MNEILTNPGNHIDSNLYHSLNEIAPGCVDLNVSLSQISRWKIGGVADVVVRPFNRFQLESLLKYFDERNLPFVIVGMTSNLLFSDNGVRVIVLQIGSGMNNFQFEGAYLKAEAGCWVPGLALKVARAGYSGVEHICGIPGTIGGLVYMNGGSMRRSIGEHVSKVISVTHDGQIITRSNSQCDFGYRHSIYQTLEEVITEVEFRFDEIDQAKNIKRRMMDILAMRRKKFQHRMPNCGSVFKANDEMYKQHGPPGAVLDRLNFKGRKIGGAQVSLIHANFINNIGGATAEEIRQLAVEMRDAVFRETGYLIESEARFVKEDGKIAPLLES